MHSRVGAGLGISIINVLRVWEALGISSTCILHVWEALGERMLNDQCIPGGSDKIGPHARAVGVGWEALRGSIIRILRVWEALGD